jgi:uncharacterized protein
VTSDKLTARLAGPAASIGAAAWNACANPEGERSPHPFTRYEFFAAVEESGSANTRSGWRPCHLVVEDDGRIVGLLPLYLKNHSQMRSSVPAVITIRSSRLPCRSRR